MQDYFLSFLPAEALRGNRFCPGENRVGEPFLSSFVEAGGWNAEGNDLEMKVLPGEESDAGVVVVGDDVVEAAAAVDAAARNGRKAPAAAAAAAEKGCLGSTKWWSPNGGG